MPNKNKPFKTSSTGESNFRTPGPPDTSEEQFTVLSAATHAMHE